MIGVELPLYYVCFTLYSKQSTHLCDVFVHMMRRVILIVQLILCGLLVRTPVFRANGLRFESGWEPTTRGESCGLSTMSNDRFERTKTAGSRAPMVLNYSRCVVLGSGPA